MAVAAFVVAAMVGGWGGVARAGSLEVERAVARSSRVEASASDRGPVRLPEELPLRRDRDGAPGSGARGAAVALALVLAVAAAIAWERRRVRRGGAPRSAWASARWLQRLGAPGAEGGVRIAHSSHLAPRGILHVVQWDGREWLVASTEHSVTILGERAHPAGAGEPAASRPGGGGRGDTP